MLLLEQGNCRLVVADDDEYSAVKFFVKYFNLAAVQGQTESFDWMLEDGSVVSVSTGEEYLVL